ncbi:lysyl oxidase family protein [Mariniblastus fucicola]|uniref:Lysyl oxidase n=1 Tax=Mariniblastus fucicola TaxID=980251 RepID=A0A5B9PAM3_9BACT|nr:lysyl oxidase family protein [Mariniblastus fucicola]QEG21546.1 Lysyl oxidase [Mariniblastus fucicola]
MPTRKNTRVKKSQFDFGKLERRNMLANDVLPDVFAWESEERGYLHDYYVEGELLRFSTAFANQGAGHLEVFGGEPTDNGNQEVFQRIYDDEGGFRDRLAGEFTYHEGHGHIHFDGYAIYNLREIGPAGEVGDILATGGKISFCLIDITRYDDDAGASNYGSCGTTQGVSAGWSDVYGSGLSDQWINISGIDDGDYYLEVVTDPEDKLLESDETNNTTIITVTIEGGPGANGDRLEPNNSFTAGYNMGIVSQRSEEGLSIHTDQDVDYYQFAAAEAGEFSVQLDFSHQLGNLDAFVYDSNLDLVTSAESLTDLEILEFDVLPGQAYFLQVLGVDGATNGYGLEMSGPGDLITTTIPSTDIPVNIPDGEGAGQAGDTITSTIEGPDITLTDLNLLFQDLDHTWMADLSIALISPAGTRAHIIRSDYEGSGEGPLGGGDNFTNTTLDDQAPTNISDADAPYTGSFNVNFGDISNPLSAFNGENALGTWTVEITDWYSADTGTLREWGLMFTGIDNNPGDVLEQNDAFPQATDLGTIGYYSHADLSIHDDADVDFFRFTAQDSTHAQIDLTYAIADGNVDFIVYDSDQQEIGRADKENDNETLRVDVVAGELYFIEVLGANGNTNTYDLTIDVPDMVANSGIIEATPDWQWVPLGGNFESPVVMASVTSTRSSAPVTVDIVDDFSNGGFQIRINTLGDGQHTSESVSYFVVEEGTHTLRDGTVIAAGQSSISNGAWNNVEFGNTFDTTPIVLGQLLNDGEAVTTRFDGISESGFDWRSQLQESTNEGSSVSHTGQWLAIELGTGSTEHTNFEVGTAKVSSGVREIELLNTYLGRKNVLASIQTFNNSDTVTTRTAFTKSRNLNSVLQEETSADSETDHGSEWIGYFVFGVGAFYAEVPQSTPPLTKRIIADNPFAADDFTPVKSKAVDSKTELVSFSRAGQIVPIKVQNVNNSRKIDNTTVVADLSGAIKLAGDRTDFDSSADLIKRTDRQDFDSIDNAFGSDTELDAFDVKVKRELSPIRG